MIPTYLNLKRIIDNTKQEIHTSSKRHEIEEIGVHMSVMWSFTLPTPAGVGHQWTIPTNKGHF